MARKLTVRNRKIDSARTLRAVPCHVQRDLEGIDWTQGGNTMAVIPLIDSATAGNNLGNLDHLFVVMMENRSFDHMLGYRSIARPGGALDPNVDALSADGEMFGIPGGFLPVFHQPETLFDDDPPHSRRATLASLGLADTLRGGTISPIFFATVCRAQRTPVIVMPIPKSRTQFSAITTSASCRSSITSPNSFAFATAGSPHRLARPGPTACSCTTVAPARMISR